MQRRGKVELLLHLYTLILSLSLQSLQSEHACGRDGAPKLPEQPDHHGHHKHPHAAGDHTRGRRSPPPERGEGVCAVRTRVQGTGRTERQTKDSVGQTEGQRRTGGGRRRSVLSLAWSEPDLCWSCTVTTWTPCTDGGWLLDTVYSCVWLLFVCVNVCVCKQTEWEVCRFR